MKKTPSHWWSVYCHVSFSGGGKYLYKISKLERSPHREILAIHLMAQALRKFVEAPI